MTKSWHALEDPDLFSTGGKFYAENRENIIRECFDRDVNE